MCLVARKSNLSHVELCGEDRALSFLYISGFSFYAVSKRCLGVSKRCLGRKRFGFFGLHIFAVWEFSRPPRCGWDCEGFAMSLCSAAVVWGFRCGLAFCQARGVWAFPGFAWALSVSATRRSV